MLITIGTQVLTTQRLTLRRFERLDFYDVYNNWASDPQVTQHMRWAPHTSPIQTARAVRLWVKEYRDPLCLHWAITLRGSRRAIGSIRLSVSEYSDDRGEVGYSLSRNHWGSGLMTEALQETLRYGFERVGFHRIEGYHAVENPASGRVMEKAGMQYEGLCRERCKLHTGRYVDCHVYAMLEEDYRGLSSEELPLQSRG